jgi:nucleoside-diphosphate-sugar epimerase
MDVLVLGGTRFLSAQVAADAVHRGDRVTCLARGESGAVPQGARFVRSDRTRPDAYDAVQHEWDEVVDVSRQPGQVRAALAALGPGARHWTFVSSGSVYAETDVPDADEMARLLPAETGEDMDPDRYGEAKVACELACEEALGDRLSRVRAGLIGGPGDLSDRLGFWPARFASAADDSDQRPVLVPLSPRGRVQVVDVRDLAVWMLDAARSGTTGVFDAVGEQTSLGHVINTAAEVAGYVGDRVKVPLGWLLEHGVEAWMGPDSLPLTLPEQGYEGFAARSGAAATAAGLRRRPLAETLADTLSYERELGLDRDRTAGLSPATERRLLAEWAASTWD